MSLVFLPQTALAYARAIARPRRVGSAEEKKVAAELAQQLDSLGYLIEQEPFHFWNVSLYALHTQVLLGVLVAGLGATGILAHRTSALALLALFVGIPFVIKMSEALALLPGKYPDGLFSQLLRRLGLVHTATNLVATLPEQANPRPAKHLYLLAHYDSKSQPLPLTVRALLFMVLLAAGIAFIALGLLAGPFGFLGPAASTAGWVVVIAGIPLILNGYGNDSPGAIDNASSVGVVVHLAELLAKAPEFRGRLQWTILLTGAEELSLMGACAFVQRHSAEYSGVKDFYFLNFDGVGVDGHLYYDARGGRSRNGKLVSLAQAAAKSRGIAVKPLKILGALFDHIPFSRHGLDAATILAIGKGSRGIHTKADSVDQLHPRGFEQAGNLAIGIIEDLVKP